MNCSLKKKKAILSKGIGRRDPVLLSAELSGSLTRSRLGCLHLEMKSGLGFRMEKPPSLGSGWCYLSSGRLQPSYWMRETFDKGGGRSYLGQRERGSIVTKLTWWGRKQCPKRRVVLWSQFLVFCIISPSGTEVMIGWRWVSVSFSFSDNREMWCCPEERTQALDADLGTTLFVIWSKTLTSAVSVFSPVK